MDAHVIIATKNRAHDVACLLTSLGTQTHVPRTVTVVGTCEADVEGMREHPLSARGLVSIVISARAGLCVQRNAGLKHVLESARKDFYVVFFDDDFRPAMDWLERCAELLGSQPDVVGVTGRVLGDGVHGSPLVDEDASMLLAGKREPAPHWASGPEQRELDSMYGCNMAFRDRVVLANLFDENLPLYGWQEDRDYTARAKAFGRTVYAPGCRGVHLGTKSGRVSGLRFGYSQIANPLYLWRKGSMAGQQGLRFVAQHLASNVVRSIQREARNDYRGRLRGNALAIRDLITGRCHPTRILQLG